MYTLYMPRISYVVLQSNHFWYVVLFFNICNRYFSYEHFYVIYCKFWELDTDHDFLIDKENLIRYGNHALTYRIVDRIFSQVCFIRILILFFGTQLMFSTEMINLMSDSIGTSYFLRNTRVSSLQQTSLPRKVCTTLPGVR